MTHSSVVLASFVAIFGLFGVSCGKTNDRTGDETHFQACSVDADCLGEGAAFRCELGACRMKADTAPAPTTRDPAVGSSGASEGVVGTGSGGLNPKGSTGGVQDAGRRDAGSGSGHSPGDAALDAGSVRHFGTAISPGAVGCGPIPACQSPVGKCCSSTAAASGGGCGPLSGVCSSNITLECDGPEDCRDGVCSGEPYGGGVQSKCAPTAGTYFVCHDHSQCPSGKPNCCPIFTDQFQPFLGECDTRSALTTGACDTPSDREVDASVAVVGPPYKTVITPDVIGCGSTPGCQSPTIQCCANFSDPGGTCATGAGVCTSQLTLHCDGPEDCASGVCSGEASGGGVQTACAPTPGTYQICHDHTQCTSDAPNCCPIYSDQFKPYLGECDRRTVLSTGACDTP